jgi:hypothetical protein
MSTLTLTLTDELDAIDADEGASHDAVRATLTTLRDEPADDAPTVTDAGAADVVVPVEDAPAGIVAETAKDPQAALNGAQVDSLRQIVLDVAAGTYSRATGEAILATAFPLTPAATSRTIWRRLSTCAPLSAACGSFAVSATMPAGASSTGTTTSAAPASVTVGASSAGSSRRVVSVARTASWLAPSSASIASSSSVRVRVSVDMGGLLLSRHRES